MGDLVIRGERKSLSRTLLKTLMERKSRLRGVFEITFRSPEFVFPRSTNRA